MLSDLPHATGLHQLLSYSATQLLSYSSFPLSSLFLCSYTPRPAPCSLPSYPPSSVHPQASSSMLQKWKHRLSISPKKQQQQQQRESSINKAGHALQDTLVTPLAQAHVRVDSATASISSSAGASSTHHRAMQQLHANGSNMSTPTLASAISSEEGSLLSTQSIGLPQSTVAITTGQLQDLYKRQGPLRGVSACPQSIQPIQQADVPEKTSSPPSRSSMDMGDNMFAALGLQSVAQRPAQLVIQTTVTQSTSRKTNRSFYSNDDKVSWMVQSAEQSDEDVFTAREQALQRLESTSPRPAHDEEVTAASPLPSKVSGIELHDDQEMVATLTQAAVWADSFYDEDSFIHDLPKPGLPQSPAGSDRSSLRRMTTDDYNVLVQTMATAPDSEEDTYQDDEEVMEKHERELSSWRSKQDSSNMLSKQAQQPAEQDIFKPLPKYRKTKLSQSVNEVPPSRSLRALPADDPDDDIPLDQLFARDVALKDMAGIRFSASTPNLLDRPTISPIQPPRRPFAGEPPARTYSSSSLLGLHKQNSSTSDVAEAPRKSPFRNTNGSGGTLLEQAARQQERRQQLMRGSSSDSTTFRPLASTSLQASASPYRSASPARPSNTSLRGIYPKENPAQQQLEQVGTLSTMLNHYISIARAAQLTAQDAEERVVALQTQLDALNTLDHSLPGFFNEMQRTESPSPLTKSQRPKSEAPSLSLSLRMPVLQAPIPQQGVQSSLITQPAKRPESAISATSSSISKRYRQPQMQAHASFASVGSASTGSLPPVSQSRYTPRLSLSPTQSTCVETVGQQENQMDEEELWQRLAQQKRRLGKSTSA
ncbi:hypothetical protein BCR37DRAFT_396037 [Protomyces lactucae-debilis]|uniref:Uncharacterized protein n=1 Tax=Protomyces lactucae-debilis TaxID=2754530 RepID=A0A1Y2FUA8_PROLT|nr:uncharacterized protein BCR37DRAFT_396037 [Protomyces lactucae-debilis]ORY87568.1 hypothetical protein BCR37DRAFT_396037 [Protomyces lactucae-debilis]